MIETSRRATLRDIARNLGLSIATVSRALHDASSPYIAQATRIRVLAEAERIGYAPNVAGRTLATGESRQIAYWSSFLFTPYYARIAQEIYGQAMAHDYQIVFHSLHDLPRSLPRIDIADGILLCDAVYHLGQNLDWLRRQTRAIVSFGVEFYAEVDHVQIDLEAGADAAMAHFLESGAKKIVLLTNANDDSDLRTVAYRKAMDEAGLARRVVEIASQSRTLAFNAIRAHVCSRGVPDAVFCVNDEVAMGCYAGLRAEGARVPDDVLLVGCDGIEDTLYCETPITTIVTPRESLGRLAWELLEQRLQKPDLPIQSHRVVPELQIRASSRRPG